MGSAGFSNKLIFLVLVLLGLGSIPFLSYRLVPDTTLPSLRISFTYPEASQSMVEKEVTSLLEGVIVAGVPDLKSITTKSYQGKGVIQLSFAKEVDLISKRFEVSVLIRQIANKLPTGISYPIISYRKRKENDTRVVSYSLQLPEEDTSEKFIANILLPSLYSIEGISDIAIEGVPEYFYEIIYDTEQIHILGVTPQNIQEQIKRVFKNEKLGIVTKNTQEIGVAINPSFSIKKLENTIIKTIDGKHITVKDIALLKKKERENNNSYRINGLQTLSFSVFTSSGANQIAIANQVKRKIEDLRKVYRNTEFNLLTDETEYIKEELIDVGYRTLLSLGFLMILSIISYKNRQDIQNLFISLLVTILISILCFKICNIEIHIYSLMSLAISLGFIIDNSIIVIDHYKRDMSKRILFPLLASTITTLLPLILISSLDKKIQDYLSDFSWVLVIVLCVSLLVSYFLTPYLPNNKTNTKKTNTIKRKRFSLSLMSFYVTFMLKIRKFRGAILLILTLFFGLPVFLLPKQIEDTTLFAKVYNETIGSEYYNKKLRKNVDRYLGGFLYHFIDNSDDVNFVNIPGRLSVSVRIKPPFGSTLEYINMICETIEKSLVKNKEFKGIDYFKTEIYNEQSAEIKVFFKDQYNDSRLPYKVKGFLEQQVIAMSGIGFTVSGVGKPFGTGIGGEYYDATLVLKGYDYNQLKEYAEIVSQKLSANNRVEDIAVMSEPSWKGKTGIQYVAKGKNNHQKEKLKSLASFYRSNSIGNFVLEKNDIALQLTPSSKKENDIYKVLENPLQKDSTFLRAKHFTQLELKKLPEYILKKDQEYQLALQYKFKGTFKHNQFVKEEMIKDVTTFLETGFSIEDGNDYSFKPKASTIAISLVACILAIFSICSILFESLKKPLIIIASIPITFIGVFAGLSYFEIGFNSGVYAGLILLTGLLVNSIIFIINEFIYLSKTRSVVQAYTKAFLKKIKPICITILSTIIGLVPFFIENQEKNDFWSPFAATVSIGLIFSLLSIILVTPLFILPKKKKEI